MGFRIDGFLEQMDFENRWVLGTNVFRTYISHFAYACKTEGKNGISRLISTLCVNCLISIPEYSRLNHLDVHLVWTTS